MIAGNGQLPLLFARAAHAQGLRVIAVAHHGETDPALAQCVDELTWVRVGQINRIRQALVRAGVKRAAMAGGIGHVKALHQARPDWGALRIISKLTSFRDDGLLRAVAADFESAGIEIVAPTLFLKEVLASVGLIAGHALSAAEAKDVALGREVALQLGAADVGQTVVVRAGHVLAVEAVEGTDEAIRRGCLLGGPGVVVIKLSKPGQDERFDLPAVGPGTLSVMAEGRARVLAIQSGKTLILEGEQFVQEAERGGISVLGV